MKGKRRLSASVDADLLRAAEKAARDGRAATVSAWINDALRLKVTHDERLRALSVFVANYEAQHGVIAPEEIESATRRARARALTVRTLAAPSPRPRKGRKVA